LFAHQIEVVEHGGERRAQVVHDHVHHAVAHALQLALLGQQILKLALLPAKLQVDGDTRLDLLDVKGLGDVVEPTHGERAHLVHGFPVRADEDDGDGRQELVLLQFRAHLVSVHPRHVDVEQDEIGRIRFARQQGQPAAGDRPRAVAASLEHVRQHLQVGRRVIHDQDAWGREVGGRAFAHVC
jgi:hypothetical protein